YLPPFVTLHAQDLYSGVPVFGSYPALVTVLIVSPCTSPLNPQPHGTPMISTSFPSTFKVCIRSVTIASIVTSPRGVDILTGSPDFTPRFLARFLLISAKLEGINSFNCGVFRVTPPDKNCSVTM